MVHEANREVRLLFRPFQTAPPGTATPRPSWQRHPIWALLGVRPPAAQHTRDEHAALRRWAAGRRSLVEIGVAEGVSAYALRRSMAPDGRLYLVDPFHLSRWRWVNAQRRVARRLVARVDRGEVVWLEAFSLEVARSWRTPIDFLFLDGDHAASAVMADWQAWSPHVVPGGYVVFHDAVPFPDGWPRSDDGPVRVTRHLFEEGAAGPEWCVRERVHSLLLVERRPA